MEISIILLSVSVILIAISQIRTISITKQLWQQQQQQQKQLEQLLKERSE